MIQQTNSFILATVPVKNELENWVKEVAALCEPKSIHWVDGSQGEYDSLCQVLVKKPPCDW